MADDPDDHRATLEPDADPLRRRAFLVGTAFSVGTVAGAVVLVALAAVVGVREASTTVFVLGVLAFGVGLLGWSGSTMAGRSIETMQAHLGSATGWTERKSRRAMARVGGFGAGVMAGTAVVGTLLGV